jgi:hypothetical protein
MHSAYNQGILYLYISEFETHHPIMKPDKINLSLALLIILGIFSWISSCTHKTDTALVPEICFKDVSAIIGSNCAIQNCHDGNGEAIPLISYDDIHYAVSPYNPDKSQLYKAITTVWGEKKMPPDQPISEESRSIIRFWIEQGAMDSTENSSFCRTSQAKGRNGSNNF